MKLITWHNNKYVKKLVRTYVMICIGGILYYIWYRITNIGIPCMFYTITGFKCPGCGITRMITELSRLHFRDAFGYNPLLFILFPYGMFVGIRHLVYAIVMGMKYPYGKRHKVILYCVIAMLIIFGVVRNI